MPLLPLIWWFIFTFPTLNALKNGQISSHSRCRFSPLYSRDQVLQNSTAFELDIFYWNGRLHQENIGLQLSNGMTFDHRLLNSSTGIPFVNQSQNSNPGNEAFHIMLLAQAITGSPEASRYLYPDNPDGAEQLAGALLYAKLNTYLQFNYTFPGFAGFLPTFFTGTKMIQPAENWHNRVSAVENGKLVWAVYGLCESLRTSNITEFRQLGTSWEEWLNYTKINAKGVFLRNAEIGEVCKISTLVEGTFPYTSFQKYRCEDSCFVDDPFEGELITWFLHFSGMLNGTQQAALWNAKRPRLQAANYTGAIAAPAKCHETVDYTQQPLSGRHIVPITVQVGLFFGSQETLKLLFLPYLDVPIVKRVFDNAERVRTCNSWLMHNPGMFAATHNITNSQFGSEEPALIENAGVPPVSYVEIQELDLVAPYSVFPTILSDRGIGLVWLKTMLDAKGVQSPFGSIAGLRRDGTGISSLVSWRTNAPIVLALLDGFVPLVRDAMKQQGIYDEFLNITQREYGRIFDPSVNGGSTFMGEDVNLCLPNAYVPAGGGVEDFSSCH